MNKKEYTFNVGGKDITAVFSDLADQTNGSVMVRCGETVVMVNTTMPAHPKDIDYFPLTVDFEEKFYAAGKILGGQFIRREGRPTEEATLSSRIIDRTIRPLFDQHIRHDIQVVATTLSIDDENDPDVLAIIGTSIALSVSDIPWNGPVGAVRIAKTKDSGLLINPNYRMKEEFIFDAVICGKDGKINMIETEAKEISESVMNEAFALAVSEISKIEKFQKDLVAQIGKEKIKIESHKLSDEAKKLFDEKIRPSVEGAVFSGAGSQSINELEEGWTDLVKEFLPDENVGLAKEYFNHVIDEVLHEEALTKERRADGRKLDELRSLFAQAGGISSIVHGSGIFYRGGTHVLSVLTLGGPGDSQTLDGMEVSEKKYFMHHYNFPPYSSGETGRIGVNRRAIGHGALAEKALRATLPSRDKFPYTIRLVSESMASNGSTSMASICASSLALMDGGVPISRPVAGIAMGLILSDKGEYKILTDIQGPEDHHGDMDFKVAGTREGLAAIQLDVKVDGIDPKILSEALEKAKSARLQILDVIGKAISAPRQNLASRAPKIEITKVDIEKIGIVIGPGGKTIQQITRDFDVAVDIQQEDGSVFITGKDLDKVLSAKKVIEGLVKEYKPGEIYEGEVVKVVEFGAFVKIAPNTEGLVHISEIAPFRINNVGDVLKMGEKVKVEIRAIDERGKISLSIKSADPDFAKRKGLSGR